MRADELSPPRGDSFKFEHVGDALTGTVAYVGEWHDQTNKFNGMTEKVMRLGVDTGNGDVVYVWPRQGSTMADALGQAVRDAELPELVAGQKVTLTYSADKDTGKPVPLKMYTATLAAGELEPPF